jgi:DNA end-binding protein Ku
MMSFPVKLYVTADREVSPLHQMCTEHHARINERKWCQLGEHEVAADQLGKCIQVGEDVVQITPEQLASLPQVADRLITIEKFIPLNSIDSVGDVYRRQMYYVAPDKGGEQPMGLLSQAMTSDFSAGLGRITMNGRERMCLLEPDHGGLLLTTLYWAYEVRSPERLAHSKPGTDAALKMAVRLIRSMHGKFEPEKYHDIYEDALQTMLDEATLVANTGQSVKSPEKAVPDLMDALKASVEAAKKRPRKPVAKKVAS